MSSDVKRFCAFPSDFVKNIDENQSLNAPSKQHPVSELIELCKKYSWNPPIFSDVTEIGESHEKLFAMSVVVNEQIYRSDSQSTSKKKAKATVAKEALRQIKSVEKH